VNLKCLGSGAFGQGSGWVLVGFVGVFVGFEFCIGSDLGLEFGLEFGLVVGFEPVLSLTIVNYFFSAFFEKNL